MMAIEDHHGDLPPGDVYMMRDKSATETAVFVVSPTPSADPNEPLNWSPWRKHLNFGLTVALTVAAFTNLSLQTVFWQQMGPDLNVTTSQLSNSQSAQVAGLALGCAFVIPFTVKYGRRSTYILSTLVMAAVTWWTSRMHTYAELIITNIITGFAGAINETAAQMTIADLYFIHQRGSANAVYFTAVMVGSFLTPIAGGAQAEAQGWRWSFYTLSICTTVLVVVFVFLLEETKYIPVTVGHVESNQSPQYSTHQSAEDAKAEMDANETFPASSDSTVMYPKATWRHRLRWTTPTSESLLRVFLLPLEVITLPHIFFTALQFASGVCWLVLFMGTVSIIFTAPPYNFGTAGIGYMTIGPFVGNIFGALYGGPLCDWFIVRLAKRNRGLYEPEMRLYLLALPTIMMAGGYMMFGITAARGMHWIYPSLGGAFFAFGLGANGDITFTLIIDTYRELTAEAFVGIAFIRNAISVAVPFTTVHWMASMGIQNMFILAGSIAFAIGLLFVPMVIWGKRIRIALAPRYWRLVEKHHAR